ncbi:MAG: AsmA family protein [Candidatus Avelusimicrobium sp.]|uniref:AsmA family protein n=1 Tax=Candidatus Avelusimicrobium sp. TaxID=3048833 RepID=UPI003F050DE0
MKKLFKLLLKTVIVLAVLGGAALVTLRIMFPPEKIKSMILDYAKNTLHREIMFDGVSFNIIGVTLDHFALSEADSFQAGTFVKADKLSVKVALMPLLKKRVEISAVIVDGLDVNVIKQKDGSFNFDSLISAEEGKTAPQNTQPEAAEASAFVLTAEKIAVTDCNFSYKDLQTGMTAGLEHLNVEINGFDLDNPFDAKITFTTEFQQKNGPAVSIPVHIALRVFLANLELKNAYVTLNNLDASYKTVKFQLKGGMKDFTAPVADLSGTLSGINNTIFADFLPDLPIFSLPVINMSVQASANLDTSSAVLQNIALSVQDSSLTAKGSVGWGAAAPTYNVNANLKADLKQLVQMTDVVNGFNPAGVISGTFKATDKLNGQDVSGTVTFSDLSALYEPVTLSETNGVIKIVSVNEISCDTLTGRLNGEKFTTSFSYKNIKDVMNIVFKLDLDKLILASFPKSASPEETTTQTDIPADQQPAAAESEIKMNIKANVKVGEIRVPYFRADEFNANAALTSVTPSMTQTNGSVSFVLQSGAVTDIDSVVKENKIVKILLLPITIIRKVAGVLNIDLFPAENSAKQGEIAYSKAEGLYTFTNGVMNLDKTVLESKLTNINGNGNINFHTNKLDMKVSATVLTSQTPIIIKIGGTMDNPSGKLDVLNTVGSMLGGILNYKTPAKVVSGTTQTAGSVAAGAVKTTGKVTDAGVDAVKGTVNAAKDTLKGIGSLFKKKDDSTDK